MAQEWTDIGNKLDRNISKVIFANNKYVALLTTEGAEYGNDLVAASDDGVDWDIGLLADNYILDDIAFGNDIFVGIRGGGSLNRFFTSPDGINWTTRNPNLGNNLQQGRNNIAFGNGLFVAVSNSGGYYPNTVSNPLYRITTSPDGIDWIQRPAPIEDAWASICFGGGQFVARGTNYIIVSEDGINWQEYSVNSTVMPTTIVYGGGLFISQKSADNFVTSSDGINWTLRQAPSTPGWTSPGGTNRQIGGFCYGEVAGSGLWVAWASNTSRARLIVESTDGLNWIVSKPAEQQVLNRAGYFAFGNMWFAGIYNQTALLNDPIVLRRIVMSKIIIRPVISGQDEDIGIKSTTFGYDYTVQHGLNDVVNVTEAINGNIFAAKNNISLGVEQTAFVNSTVFASLDQGIHTLTITATDTSNVSATRTLTFEKKVASFFIEKSSPISATVQPGKCTVKVDSGIPFGASLRIEATNNPFDSEPIWEDCTRATQLGLTYVFENDVNQSVQYGFSFRITVEKGTVTETCWVSGIEGSFE
ncbi:MAG: hypothetical protein LBJ12_01410 [Oscillospiraceae bacterium]|jgi:hypothetical protein|nr:hypothetical protein [Oscillospiraceae bacterium]